MLNENIRVKIFRQIEKLRFDTFKRTQFYFLRAET